MNFSNLYIFSHYKLYFLFSTYNLNYTYVNYKSISVHRTQFIFHKKWIKNYETYNSLMNLTNYNIKWSWQSTVSRYYINNSQLVKYIQLTTLNFNVNRNLTYLTLNEIPIMKTIKIYNFWFQKNQLSYNYQLMFYSSFLKTFFSTIPSSVLQNINSSLFVIKPILTKVTLLHNIKFL
jgi:hypothetical protein